MPQQARWSDPGWMLLVLATLLLGVWLAIGQGSGDRISPLSGDVDDEVAGAGILDEGFPFDTPLTSVIVADPPVRGASSPRARASSTPTGTPPRAPTRSPSQPPGTPRPTTNPQPSPDSAAPSPAPTTPVPAPVTPAPAATVTAPTPAPAPVVPAVPTDTLPARPPTPLDQILDPSVTPILGPIGRLVVEPLLTSGSE